MVSAASGLFSRKRLSMRHRIGRSVRWMSLLALACTHGEAFTPDVPSANQPLLPGQPTRLTLNPLIDLDASWLPDGSGILYSYQVPGRSDRDRCLGILPPDGGTRRLEICDPQPETSDTIDAFGPSAVSTGGQLAYVVFRARASVHTPQFSSSLLLAPLSDALATAVLTTTPYTLPTGQFHGAISHLAWLDDSRLVYVGQDIFYIRLPVGTIGTAPDTLPTGRDIVVVELGGSSPQFSAEPNTGLASSVTPGENPNTIYYTVSGDSQVYRRDLGSGATTVIHDFGTGTIVRDVSVKGTTLVAIVGGRVEFIDDPVLGPVQPDEGGVLTMVDLATSTETVLDPSPTVVYRRPALSPDGLKLVVERYQVLPGSVDRRADLYLFTLP